MISIKYECNENQWDEIIKKSNAKLKSKYFQSKLPCYVL